MKGCSSCGFGGELQKTAAEVTDKYATKPKPRYVVAFECPNCRHVQHTPEPRFKPLMWDEL